MLRGLLSAWLTTPNPLGLARLSDTEPELAVFVPNRGWLKALKKSAVNTIRKRSVARIFLPTERSTFQVRGSLSASAFGRPSTPGNGARRALNTAAGSAKILIPVPPVAGSPLVPTPLDPATPWRPLALPKKVAPTVQVNPFGAP